MNRSGPFDPRKEAHLLSAFVDGELEPHDEARIRAHLEENEDTRREVEELRRLKDLTGQMRLKEPPAEEWEAFWHSVYNRAERSIGWILLTAGIILLGSWTLVQLAMTLVSTTAISQPIKAGIFIVAAGSLTLLVSVIRERIHTRKHTRYRDIKR
nr:zf-HC2 domain-containing protein [Candidatus Krumholzibacteria bacterium]